MRAAGVILHISSLPSPYGVGTLGRAAFDFVDFLQQSGMKYWQVLPIVPPGSGDSPYSSHSAFAGNPNFIDLDLLCEDGLLKKEDYARLSWGKNPRRVNYKLLGEKRLKVLRKAYERGFERDREEIAGFRECHCAWVEDYALYMALKEKFGELPWMEWEPDIRDRKPEAVERYRAELEKQIEFWIYVQYLFYKQWNELKLYANDKGIGIIGDIPIYVFLDSADVWSDRSLFWLDENNTPVMVAGVPPDAFSADGQLWGNPLYRWDLMEQDGYAWWMRRVRHAAELHDKIRIDHFRGFCQFFAIPVEAESAKEGEWCEGPGMDFFRTMEEKLGKVDIIAEDLGVITPDVRELLRQTGLPGMKVLQFAFTDSSNAYLPHNFAGPNCVVYTGTHDNDTAAGWFANGPEEEVAFGKEYMAAGDQPHWDLLRTAWGSVAETAVCQMQDLLGEGSEHRMNIPATPSGNWGYRMAPGSCTPELAKRIHRMLTLYGRA